MEDKITVREEVKEPIEWNVKNGSHSGVVGLAILVIIGNMLEMQILDYTPQLPTQKL